MCVACVCVCGVPWRVLCAVCDVACSVGGGIKSSTAGRDFVERRDTENLITHTEYLGGGGGGVSTYTTNIR